MNVAAAGLALVMAASWWPFGRDDAGAQPDTVGSLPEVEIEVRKDQSLPDAERRALEQYRAFLARDAGDDAMTAEALRRLADLLLDGDEALRIGAGAERLDGGAHGEALTLYATLLERFPSHPRNDEVRYQLARAHELAGDRDAALAGLDALVAMHPDSPLVGEAQFRRGEMLFAAGRYRDAEPAYVAALAHPSAAAFERQSRYKLGWSLYRQGLPGEALVAFGDLLLAIGARAPSAEARDALSRPERELLDDTLRVMALSLSSLDGVTTLHHGLDDRPATEGWSIALHEALAALYRGQERYTETRDVLQAYVARHPYDAAAPRMALSGMDALREGGFPSLLLDAKAAFVDDFGLDTAFWTHHDERTQQATVDALESALTTLAHHHHAEMQRLVAQLAEDADPPSRTGGDGAPPRADTRADTVAIAAERDMAIERYRRLLAWFPGAEAAPGHHFLLAELLLEADAPLDAAHAFEAVAYDYPRHAQSAEAGYAALLARDQALQRNDVAAQGATARASRLARIDVAARFAREFPGHDAALAVLTDAAERAFELDETGLALSLAGAVLDADPPASDVQRRVAWRIDGHVHFDRADYAAAEHAYWRVHEGLVDGEDDAARGEVEERLAAAIYRQGEAARDAGRYGDAAAHFLRVPARLPGAGIVAQARFDAGIAWLAAGEHAAAIDTLARFRSEHPDHPLVERTGLNLATAYEAYGDTGAAAREYRRLAAQFDDRDEQRGALWKASALWLEAGDVAAAEDTLVELAEAHADAAGEALDAHRQLLELALDRDAQALALTRAEALLAFEASQPRTPQSRRLAARAALLLADDAGRRALDSPLTMPLERSIAQRRERMEAALDAYARAAAFGVTAVVTAATFATAEQYHGLARALFESPRPADLDALALEQYEMLLEEQAFPFEERAIEIHESNARRAADGVYDRWVEASFDALATLLPARYAKHELGEIHVARLH